LKNLSGHVEEMKKQFVDTFGKAGRVGQVCYKIQQFSHPSTFLLSKVFFQHFFKINLLRTLLSSLSKMRDKVPCERVVSEP
jgi:hypothetical protein